MQGPAVALPVHPQLVWGLELHPQDRGRGSADVIWLCRRCVCGGGGSEHGHIGYQQTGWEE